LNSLIAIGAVVYRHGNVPHQVSLAHSSPNGETACPMGLLRTILAITVVISHTPNPYFFVGARNAVQVFYMISGFLISYVLLNTPSYKSPLIFWINRALRLYPIYYVVAALTLVGHAMFNPNYWAEIFQLSDGVRAFLATAAVTILGQDWTTFFTAQNGKLIFYSPGAENGIRLTNLLPVVQAWTLGVELSFYLLAPFIVSRPVVLLTLFCISLGARLLAIMSGFGLNDPWTDRFFPFELALFIAGMASHQLLLLRVKAAVSMPSTKRLPNYVLLATLFFGVIYYPIPLPEIVKTPILFGMMFFALPFLFILQSENRWDRRIGDLSYPIYIGHLLILLALAYLVKKYQFIEPLGLTRSLLGVAGAIAFAVVLNIFIAEPVENRRRWIRGKPKG
jgi:peptidoglycan/LPS O-acetylase OafA/YrhL